MRAYMWGRLKTWLETGMIPKDDVRLEQDLSGPGYHLNTKNQLVLEPKASLVARGVASPDDADALCLTWARPVQPPTPQGRPRVAWLPVSQHWAG